MTWAAVPTDTSPTEATRKHSLDSVWVQQTVGNIDGTVYCRANQISTLAILKFVLKAKEGFAIKMQDLQKNILSPIYISCFWTEKLVETLNFYQDLPHWKYKCLVCARGANGHSHSNYLTSVLSFIKHLPSYYIIWSLQQTSKKSKVNIRIAILQKSKLTVAEMFCCLPISTFPLLFHESFLGFCPVNRLFPSLLLS